MVYIKKGIRRKEKKKQVLKYKDFRITTINTNIDNDNNNNRIVFDIRFLFRFSINLYTY